MDIQMASSDVLTSTANKGIQKSDKDLQKEKKAAEEFESYLIGYMLKEMRKTIPKSGLTGSGGFEQDTYYEMLDEQIARNMAENGGFGLAKQIMKNEFEKAGKGN